MIKSPSAKISVILPLLFVLSILYLESSVSAGVTDSSNLTSLELISNPTSGQNTSTDYSSAIGPNTLNRFYNLLLDIDNDEGCKGISELETVLENVCAEDREYSFYDIAVYYSGLYAHLCGNVEKAMFFYETYLKRRSGDRAQSLFPSWIWHDENIKNIRKIGISLQERVSRKWDDDRWAFHFFKPDQRGFEFQNVLSNLAQTYYLNTVLSLEGFKDLISRLDSNNGGNESNIGATKDFAYFEQALIYKKRGESKRAICIIDSLTASKSLYPISSKLLSHVQDPPKIICHFRERALFTLLAIILIGTGTFVFLYFKAKSRAPKDTIYSHKQYLIHKGDPFMHIIIDRLQLNGFDVFMFSIFVLAFGQTALAWSEESLFRNSFIVDRNFFDYYSFPFGLGLLMPIFFSVSVFFYRYVPKQLKMLFVQGIFSGIRDTKNSLEHLPTIRSIFTKYLNFCNSGALPVVIFIVALSIMLAQKMVWIKDGGTAFVDLWYPGYYSLTGVYFTITSILVYYVVISVFVRGGATLIMISKIFSGKNVVLDEFEPKYEIEHPDGCCGTRSLGLILVLFYFLLFLLGAQLVLNVVEKSIFYESLEIVLDQTRVSVVMFGIVFFAVCPGLIAAPLLSMHISMRHYRYSTLLKISKDIKQQQEIVNNLIENNKLDEKYILALEYYTKLSEKVKKMPLWPADVKTVSYLGASNLLPVITFFVPFIL